MAVIQCVEEVRYFQNFPFLELFSERMQAIEATMSQLLLGPLPLIPNPRIVIAPGSGSDGVVAHKEVSALQNANRVLVARALADERRDAENRDGDDRRSRSP